MLVFDQLKKDDPHLRVVALAVLGGLGVLLVGLWWVQVVSAREFQANLETQSFRSVRIPAVRGKILDRNGAVLAENRPSYNVSLYLEELRKPFDAAYFAEVTRKRTELKRELARQEQKLGRSLTKEERKGYTLQPRDRLQIRQATRCAVASNAVNQTSQRLRQPLPFDAAKFERHYQTRLALPYPVLTDLNSTQVALFEEQTSGLQGIDLERQSTRVYPYQTIGGHLLGYLTRDDDSLEGEESFFSYRMPDYRGVVGIEGALDKELRGTAGAKSVLVNNVGYRQTENVWSQAEPGHNVVLTLDQRIQESAERALQAVDGPATRGAVVVMDVNTGDILALVSSPSVNPNQHVKGLSQEDYRRLMDPKLRPMINRATYEHYAPGSIFKTITGLAALEAGLNPKRRFHIAANPAKPSTGIIYVGKHPFHDTAPPGDLDFLEAFKLSSNCYFITNGLRAGVENIVKLGRRFHLGERTGLPTRQEVPGSFPTLQTVTKANWYDGDTANLCIGQGRIAVTPIQMAVMTAALANGGKVLFPRLIDRIESQDTLRGQPPRVFPKGRVRDTLGVNPHNLDIVRDGMLADVEDQGATGTRAAVEGLRICGKTGTAQVKNERGWLVGWITWFVSFAPYDHPQYAVVVMVERDGGGSGGRTCAPVAHEVYKTIQECERRGTAAIAQAN